MTPALLAQLGDYVNPHSGYALPPRWGWYVVLYFFFGGLAAGTYFIATLLDLAGGDRERKAIRLGYVLAFPFVILCGLLLVLDLGKPLRFWHMLIMSERPPVPLLKPWSPISLGSWILTAFGLFSFVSFVGAMVDAGRVRWSPAVRATARARGLPRPLRTAWQIVGTVFGFALAGYTGVLVSGTSLVFWHNARLMGALFLASAASTSYALLTLLLTRRGSGPATDGAVTHDAVRHDAPLVRTLTEADRWAIIIELAILVAMLALLGPVARPIIAGGFGVVFWIGVVLLGLIAPLLLHWTRIGPWAGERRVVLGSALVLGGGLLLRFVVVMSPQWPTVRLWHL